MTEESTIRVVKWLLATLPVPLFIIGFWATFAYQSAPTRPTPSQTIDVYFWGATSRFVTPLESFGFYVMYALTFVLTVSWLYAFTIKWRDDKPEL